MKIATLTLATALGLAVSGAAVAQTAAGGGRAEGNMNSPGSVKSTSEKAMERTGPASTGTVGGNVGARTGTVEGNAKSTDGETGNAAARGIK